MEEDRILRDAEKHPMLSPCNDKCKVCKQRIHEDMRKEIHDGFWTQNYNDRRSWIRSKVSQHPPKRERPNKKGDINRMPRVYHFNDQSGEAVVVCQLFCFRTLGFLKDHVVKTAIKTTKHSIVPAKDKRGSFPATNKITPDVDEKVKRHILKFGPSVSHYRRAHAPYRLYISPEFDCCAMHRDYVKEHPENVVSYAYYSKMVKSLNISFVKLGEEECELCELHSNHLKETEKIAMEGDEPVCKKKKGNEKRVVDGCAVCSTFSKHTETSNRSREEYKHDKERKVQDNEVVISTDMQQVLASKNARVKNCNIPSEIGGVPSDFCTPWW